MSVVGTSATELVVAVVVRWQEWRQAIRSATEPTLTVDQVTTWWNETPMWAKGAVAGVALVLVVIGIVRKMVVLTFIAALVGLGLIGWWWWANYGSKL